MAAPLMSAPLDAAVAEAFDLVVLAEGGLFAEQAGRALHRDYGQTAWVGELCLGAGGPRGISLSCALYSLAMTGRLVQISADH